jgi:hypothetical protein
MVNLAEQKHKSHHAAQSGNKAAKRKGNPKNNQRAFAFASKDAANRAGRRNMDREERKLHVPLVDRTPIEPPPVIVAVVGPPKVSIMLVEMYIRCANMVGIFMLPCINGAAIDESASVRPLI